MIHGVHRTKPAELNDRQPGWRVLLPMIPAWRRGYSVAQDGFVTGLWWFSIGLSLETIGKSFNGLSIRLTWGWSASAVPMTAPGPYVA